MSVSSNDNGLFGETNEQRIFSKYVVINYVLNVMCIYNAQRKISPK